MRKFLIKLIQFAGFSFLIYVILIFLWGNFFNSKTNKNLNYKQGSNGHLFTRLREIKKYRNVDILFVGSSHAYRNFDPRIFSRYGIKTFNLGLSSQTPIQTWMVLKRYLEKLNPKLLVYDVYPATFESDGVESAIDFISNSEFNFDLISMALKINNIKVYNTLLYRIVLEFLGLNNNFKENLVRGRDKYISGGYVERDDTIKLIKQNLKPKKWMFNKYSKNQFEFILKYLRNRSGKLLLVNTPVRKEFYNSYINNDEVDGYFKSRGMYLNFNKNSLLNDSVHFYDNHHLNKKGVKVFNEYFINVLNKIYE